MTTHSSSQAMEHGVISWRTSSRSAGGSNGANCVEAGAWRKSRRSSNAGGQNCLEAGACTCHGIAVRDTKHRDGGVLTIDRAEWATLLTAVNHGDLNH